jgi:hypothetical protein
MTTLLNTMVEKVTKTLYTIQLEDGSTVFRIEMRDENGKWLDSITRSQDGYSLDEGDNESILVNEEIDAFLNMLEGNGVN